MSEYKEYTVRVYEDRTEWKVGNKLHRDNGPAVEYVSGGSEWWCDGKQHRIGGPAVTWSDGCMVWYVDGKRHREDGPAVMWPCSSGGMDGGYREWWINGEQMSEDEFNERTNPPAAPCDGKVVEIDGKRYRLVAE